MEISIFFSSVVCLSSSLHSLHFPREFGSWLLGWGNLVLFPWPSTREVGKLGSRVSEEWGVIKQVWKLWVFPFSQYLSVSVNIMTCSVINHEPSTVNHDILICYFLHTHYKLYALHSYSSVHILCPHQFSRQDLTWLTSSLLPPPFIIHHS